MCDKFNEDFEFCETTYVDVDTADTNIEYQGLIVKEDDVIHKLLSLICFIILLLVLYFHCKRTLSFEIEERSLCITSSSLTIKYFSPSYS